MDWEAQLIFVYLTVCHFFMQDPRRKKIRNSPNNILIFTDEEVIAIYIFGILSGHRTVKNIHKFTYCHIGNWFPNLPKYNAFLHRINILMTEIVSFSDAFIQKFNCKNDNKENPILIDSMPIILAKGSRAPNAKVAKQTAKLGYCASKKLYYHGVKFHMFAEYKDNSLPKPRLLEITQANVHDLKAVKQIFADFSGCKIIGDKAYCDSQCKQILAAKNIELHTPIKLSKNKQELNSDELSYCKVINSFRQSIEILFSWLIEKTGIQNASKVRSEQGLGVHIFGRFAAALILLGTSGNVYFS